jgi:hypothetical protein
VKEAVIVLGSETAITNRVLAEALGLGASAVSKQVVAARARGAESSDLVKLRKLVRSRVRSSSNGKKVNPSCATARMPAPLMPAPLTAPAVLECVNVSRDQTLEHLIQKQVQP